MTHNLLAGLNVLVVDRHLEGRSILRDQMCKMGAQSIRTAPGIRGALDLIRDAVPDLIVSDWSDDVNGLRLSKALGTANSPRYRSVPVVLIAAHSNAKAMKAARDAGVAAILIRPYSLQCMAQRLRKVLSRGITRAA